MVYNYICNLDKELNETINLYKNVGKLSIPILKYLILILSFFICTSCFVLLYYISTYNTCSNTNIHINNIFTDIILPIIIYGLICPIFSVIIGGIFKIFIDNFIQQIKNKQLYLKYIQHNQYNNLISYLFYNKPQLYYCFLYLFIYFLPFYFHFIYLFIYIFIQISRLFLFYKNKINCKIISVQNCYNNKENFWNFDLEIDINSEKKIISKRFNDFKYLSHNLIKNIKLPTNNWITKPITLTDAKIRAQELNKYITNITESDSILNNSTFINFINTTNTNSNTNNIILEKDYINNIDIINNINNINNIYSNIDNIKYNCSKLINEPILNLFILNEINYYNSIKKRIIILTENKLYKIKYYITFNTFEIRKIINFIDIDYIEISTIKNTFYSYNTNILILYFKNQDIKLTSIDTSYFYNIYSLLNIFNNKSIIIINTDSIQLNNGYGITENILNNHIFQSIRYLF